MNWTTPDLCDAHEGKIHVAEPIFLDYGGVTRFCGQIATVKLFEDNSRVRDALNEPGRGRVLVVDGGGSLRCALLGDQLGELAVKNGWSGLVINGCVRDSAALAELDLGVKAIGTHPQKSHKKGVGEREVSVRFAGVLFLPNHYLYGDEDGLVISSEALV